MKPQEMIPIGKMNPFVRAAIEFADDERRTLFFTGPVGCGKTHAAIVARTLHPEPGEVVTAFALSRIAPWDDAIDRISTCPGVLVIDDVGTEFEIKAGRFAAVLDGVINERDCMERKTVITTNLPIDVFRERYGARVLDRIRGNGHAVQSSAESMRGEDVGGTWIWRYPLKPDGETWSRIQDEAKRDDNRARVAEMSSALVSRLARQKTLEKQT